MKPICPICQTALFISASLHLGGMVATCPNIHCSAGEIVEVADDEADSIAQFNWAAGKLTILKSDL